MKKNVKFLCVDFLKDCRDRIDDDTLRRRYSAVLDVFLNNINLVDYLIYKSNGG